MSWSPQQEQALRDVREWLRNGTRQQQVFRLFGYAGTGKTTLAKELAANVKGIVLFGAFTGKAAHVLRRKGCQDASTIHSMIYKLEESSVDSYEPRFVLDRNSAASEAALIVIDECSMVDEALGNDLLSFGKPVLVLGDPAQLPPVRGEGFFTNAEPDIMLTEVHRQAKDSPIINMATIIREGGRLEIGEYGDSRVVKRDGITSFDVLEADTVLVGKNATRTAYNRRIRELRDITAPFPQVGEKLICLRNSRVKKTLNGSIWMVGDAKKRSKRDKASQQIRLSVRAEDWPADSKTIDINVREEFFLGDEAHLEWEQKRGTDEFTFGYALTVHKSQGSQWDRIVIFDEGAVFREEAWRWRYTAITRAAQQITIVQ